jgi:nucleoside-diphosphate-sugar epimerase
VLQVAEAIWQRVNPTKPFRYVSDEPFKYDVQLRVPAIEKAARVLGFRAETPLERILDEVVSWVIAQIKLGNI